MGGWFLYAKIINCDNNHISHPSKNAVLIKITAFLLII
ncbi:hypothetical protein Mucpa_3938 [Mucilaginibacter paludis DSM 18603]|uniref:Uncharacterized protein n=1 Tax=Mucilaginibacter paludis DSM 18603 TaxID=714943 RepID=H1Y2I1_9SPHI|nr:hypothetical protein Mucpa_3938 [Mucilaginibacter paludis DSM 18603]